MDSHTSFAIQIAQEAGILLLNQFKISNLEISLKSDRSVVTKADHAADDLLTTAIRTRYPGSILVSEESSTNLSELVETNSADGLWIIDPLDGSTNYSLGLQYWGVSIAYLEKGIPVAAALYFPMLDELYSAHQGSGAYLNGNRIQVQATSRTHPISFFACCSRTFRNYDVKIPYKTRILGSAVYTMCCVARGVAIVGFEATPKIWDIAATWLLVNEAGGYIETLENQPFPIQAGVNYDGVVFPTLAAATPEVAQKSRQQLLRRQP